MLVKQDQIEEDQIRACTVSSDILKFDLLIEDMEMLMGEDWGDLSFGEATAFIQQDEARALEFLAIALDQTDENDADAIVQLVRTANEKGISIILVADNISPKFLHRLLRNGADEFLPYPLPKDELQGALDEIKRKSQTVSEVSQIQPQPQPEAIKSGKIVAVHGLAGGVGASTLAVNLAWEAATQNPKGPNPKVCLLDLDLQFGSVATYLDLDRKQSIAEMWSDTEVIDGENFKQALSKYKDTLSVLTSPNDLVPLDLISGEDLMRVLTIAKSQFDVIVINMPQTLVTWTETVLEEAHVYLNIIDMDMRTAQNIIRLVSALQAENLPFNKLRYILNRAPKFTDLNGKNRIKRLSESLGIAIEFSLPDGGKPVTQACDHGEPLGLAAPKSPLRKEIVKLVKAIFDEVEIDAKAA